MTIDLIRLAGTALLLTASSCSQEPAAAPRPASGAEEPLRLVVLCSVDQLASWVFEEGLAHFADEGGFRRLLRQGAYFTNCAYQHACTETGPGHATIGSGAPARVHGIVRNTWWSPPDGKTVYCVGHPQEPLPGLGEGADRGAGRLLAETLSEVMRRELPGCKTASISWKDRSSILMVGEHADVAAWFELQFGNLVTNTTWCAEVPAWIAKFNAARTIDSYHGQVWDRTGPESAYVGRIDDRPYELPHKNGSNARGLPQPLTGGQDKPAPGYYDQLYYSPFGNEVVRLAAQACVEGMDLGGDAVPDLLAVSFSSTDLVGHHFGPDSVEARDALLRLDRQLGDFLDFLDRRVGQGRYAFFLTADHGVGPTPEWAKAQGLDAGRGLIQTQARAVAETEIIRRFGSPPAGRRYCAYVGEWALVFDRAAFERGDGAAAAAARFDEACDLAAAAVPQVRGIAQAFTTREIFARDPGDDPIRSALWFALHPERAGDVQLVVQPYWVDGTVTASHGTPHPYDREVVGLAMGPFVPAGREVAERVTPGLGVVLFAHLLGIPAPAMAVDVVPASLRRSK